MQRFRHSSRSSQPEAEEVVTLVDGDEPESVEPRGSDGLRIVLSVRPVTAEDLVPPGTRRGLPRLPPNLWDLVEPSR